MSSEAIALGAAESAAASATTAATSATHAADSIAGIPAVVDAAAAPHVAAASAAADAAEDAALSIQPGVPGGVAELDVDGSVVDAGGVKLLNESELTTAFARGISIKASPFNATGDGTTDDSTAIRSAITAASALGAPVYVPEGTYVISRDGANTYALTLPANTRLTGPGTLKLAASTAVAVRGILVTTAGVSIDGLKLDMNRAGQTVDPTRHAIAFSAAARGTVRNCTITGATGDGILVSTGSSEISIRGNRITDCGRNGVTLYATGAGQTTTNVTIEGNHIEADVQPVDSEPDTNGSIHNVRVADNYLKSTVATEYALTMAGSAGTSNTDWTVSGNTIMGPIYVIAVNDSQIVGNTIDASLATNKQAVYANGQSDSIVLAGNRIHAATDKEGVSLFNAGAVRPVSWAITGNIISVAGGTTGRGINAQATGPVVISGNVIRGVNASQGVRVSSSGGVMEAVTVVGNDIDGFAYGVFVSTSSNLERLIVQGNTIDNSQGTPTVTAGVYFTGTSAAFLQTVLGGNLVDPVFTTPYTLGNVLIREAGGNAPTFSGNGSPEGVVTAVVSATYRRRDGGTGTTFYVKETGTGNTGWVAK